MLHCSAKVLLNHLIVNVSGPRSVRVRRMSITEIRGRVVLGFDENHDIQTLISLKPAGRSFSKQHVTYYFTSPTIVDLQVLAWLHKGALEITVQFDDQVEMQSLSVESMAMDEVLALPPKALAKLSTSQRWAGLLDALRAGRIERIYGPEVHIDYAHLINGVLFLNGWLPNFGVLEIYFLSDGAAHAAHGADAIVQGRPDASEFLRNQTRMSPATDAHGFCVGLVKCSTEGPVTVGILRDGIFHIIFSEAVSTSRSKASIFPLVLGAAQAIATVPLAKAARMLAPFLASNGGEGEYDVVLRSEWPEGVTLRLSVVVPFYKEWRFLYSILAMARSGPKDWEWVLICDDPSILLQMRQLVWGCPEDVARQITFIAVRQNVGYGPATNIGVREAAAPAVLLMNSDIWVADFESVQAGLVALGTGEFSLLGFTLLFEDGTVQHDGLAFHRARDLDDMYLALHPGKGLPPRNLSDSVEVVPVEAVTGALMLVQQALFTKAGGFSESYIGGDFEDADLCLSLTRDGHRLGLVRARGLYHLERQSMRHDAANSLGFARTLVNCERFNRRWAPTLDARGAVAGSMREVA